MAGITLKNVVKTYPGGVNVVPDLNLEIEDKEFKETEQAVFH